MEQIEFYEYCINLKKCKFVRYKCIGTKVRENLYMTKFYNDNQEYISNDRIIDFRNFNHVRSFRIMTFDDDYVYYKNLLLQEYSMMIEKNKSNLEKQIQFFENLKSSE